MKPGITAAAVLLMTAACLQASFAGRSGAAPGAELKLMKALELTWGHHFLLFAGNNQKAGARSFLAGTNREFAQSNHRNDLYFGFNILRIIDL